MPRLAPKSSEAAKQGKPAEGPWESVLPRCEAPFHRAHTRHTRHTADMDKGKGKGEGKDKGKGESR